MACKPDHTVYFINNINDSNINQNEMVFTLIPQSDNVYSIISPYGKYLMTNDNYGAAFMGTNIGPSTSWKFNKITDQEIALSNINKAKFISIGILIFVLSLSMIVNIYSNKLTMSSI